MDALYNALRFILIFCCAAIPVVVCEFFLASTNYDAECAQSANVPLDKWLVIDASVTSVSLVIAFISMLGVFWRERCVAALFVSLTLYLLFKWIWVCIGVWMLLAQKDCLGDAPDLWNMTLAACVVGILGL